MVPKYDLLPWTYYLYSSGIVGINDVWVTTPHYSSQKNQQGIKRQLFIEILLRLVLRRLLVRHLTVWIDLDQKIQSSFVSESFRREDLMKQAHLKNVLEESMFSPPTQYQSLDYQKLNKPCVYIRQFQSTLEWP